MLEIFAERVLDLFVFKHPSQVEINIKPLLYVTWFKFTRYQLVVMKVLLEVTS